MTLRNLAPLLFAFACAAPEAPESDAPVGPRAQGGHVLPTHQHVEPAGTTIAFDGRPLDLVLARGGRFAFAKDLTGVVTIDTVAGKVASRYVHEGQGSSMHGIAITRSGKRLFFSSTGDQLAELEVEEGGRLRLVRTIVLPEPAIGGEPYPCGIALAPDETSALVCLSRSNAVAWIDLGDGALRATIPVGVAPFDVVWSPDGRRAWVSNFGGRRARAGDMTADSSGTQLVVDERGIGSSGTVSELDLESRASVAEIACGLHPCDLELSRDGARLYVAAANSDAVLVLDTQARRVLEEIGVRPDARLPFGSITNALALSPDETTLYAANGGNNALAVVRLAREGGASTLAGFIPTGWFPGAIALDGERVIVANVKGEGQRGTDVKQRGWNSRNDRGSISCIPAFDAAALAAWTARAHAAARVPQALRSLSTRARGDAQPVPVPRRVGEPSTIEHVVYVIKENRTYDQVFGDLPRGNGDPALCVYGREVTPNHHALAEGFVLLDNYYCNGVVSSDGHQWATQGLVVDYQEKQFGGWTRSYDLGTDALTYAASDFLWDAVLLQGLSFRNYGEFDFPRIDAPKGSWFDVQAAARAGTLRITPSTSPAQLARYTAPNYPGWQMKISDQYRIERFLDEFRALEKDGELPNLVIVYLPQDHTSGLDEDAPTPRAHVADNDLAVGRLVEALSHSRFWPSTAIFVNEDDPQAGWDHVDGHRSLCLVVSPWARRGAVVSRFYNQTSVLRTIELILGVPPLNQQDAAASPMHECFTSEPDFASWRALENRIALDEPNPKKSASAAAALPFVALSDAQDLTRPDRIDDDAFNRVLWFAARGVEAYPSALAGPHGTGLERLGLRLDADHDEDGDDEE